MNAITLINYQVPLGATPDQNVVSQPIRAPIGTQRILFYSVCPTGLIQDPAFEVRISVESTFDSPGGVRVWRPGNANSTTGEPGRIPGGVVGGLPGEIVADPAVQWDFEPAESPAAGADGTVLDAAKVPHPLSDAWWRPTLQLLGGNPAGVWVALVAVALNAAGEGLKFDLGTKAE